MSVLVATSDGIHVLSPSSHDTLLAGHSVDSLVADDASFVAIVDRNEVWERGSDDVWRARATWDVDLSAIHVHGSSVFVGTYDARLL
ncbi:MAG: hypothetical protein ACHQIG_10490, partial [Acidimicrobiia bacterium]